MLLLIATLAVQSPAPLKTAFDTIAGHLLAASTLMPEAPYEYRATPETRSFGQIIAHVAGAQFLYCSQALGERLPADVGARLGAIRPYSDVATASRGPRVARQALIIALEDSVSSCRRAYGATVVNVAPLIENLAHSNEHYGNLVTYLRLNGLVPPSSR